MGDSGTEDNFFRAVGPNDLFGFAYSAFGVFDFGALLTGSLVGSCAASTEAEPAFRVEGFPLSRVGVFGQGDSVGVYGMTSVAGPNSEFNGSIKKAGVFGTSDHQPGVVGTSFSSFGVFGQAGDPGDPAGPAGVCGSSRQRFGVIGSSSENVAVFGQANKSIGVFGTSNSSWGVMGQSGAPAPSSFNAAVFGTSASSTGVAGTSANNFGILGTSTNSYGLVAISGVLGPIFNVPLPSPAGVFGTSADNPGVVATSAKSFGVAAYSLESNGIFGLAAALPAPNIGLFSVPSGVKGEAIRGGFGVLGVTTSFPTSPGAGVTGACGGNGFGIFGFNPDPGGFAGYFAGKVHADGEITAPVKNAIVPFPDGSKRLLHCMESPEHWFEDFGSARLKRGRATVKLDADFGKVVMLDGYRVFLTPEGDCKGLYVQSKGDASFEVRELQGGTSSIAFSYRIVAKRKDIKRHTRFAKIETPVIPMPVGKARAARGRKPAGLPSSVRALFATLEKETKKAT